LDPTYSLLSPEEIAAQLNTLSLAGYPGPPVERLIDDLTSFCRGPVAEAALAQLVTKLDAAAVARMVSKRVPGEAPDALTPIPDFDHSLLVRRLVSRGFDVVVGVGGSVRMPDGVVLGTLVPPVDGDDKATRLGRLALLGTCLIGVRNHPPISPAY
jgi:hypothetical protein